MTATVDISVREALTGSMNTPAWFAAIRPADLLGAAAALNPDASSITSTQMRWEETSSASPTLVAVRR